MYFETNLDQAYRARVCQDSDIYKNIREVHPDEESEESQPQPGSFHPDREEERGQGEDVNDGFHLKNEKQEVFSGKSPQQKIHQKNDPKHKVCLKTKL